MKKTNNILPIIIAIGIFLILISSIFAYTLRQNSIEETRRQKTEIANEDAKQKAEESKAALEKLDNQLKLSTCQNEASEYYHEWWWANCSLPSATSINKEDKTCALPTNISEPINEKYRNDLANCISLYK